MLHVWLSRCRGDITVSLKQSGRIQQTPKRKSPAGMMMMWVCSILHTGSRCASSTASACRHARGTCLFSKWSAVFIVPPCIKSLKNESSAFFSRSEDKAVWIWCFSSQQIPWKCLNTLWPPHPVCSTRHSAPVPLISAEETQYLKEAFGSRLN